MKLRRTGFHLLLEMPEANLVSGMRNLLESFGQAWNRRHQHHGHVFQGRYKSIPVNGEQASDPLQFRVVADYIHLNPARAGLAGRVQGKLTEYEWSSLPAYRRGKGPTWLVCERVLGAFELSQNGRGRRAYVDYLGKRAANDGGNLSEASMAALRRGWYPEDETFRDRLLDLVKKGSKILVKKGSVFLNLQIEKRHVLRHGAILQLPEITPSHCRTPFIRGLRKPLQPRPQFASA